jgi:hypothetical protein
MYFGGPECADDLDEARTTAFAHENTVAAQAVSGISGDDRDAQTHEAFRTSA